MNKIVYPKSDSQYLTHFVQADAAAAAKVGTLQELVDEKFG